MKILRIIARLNVGGPARHVIWLTEALQDDEFQTTLIAGTVPTGEDDMSYFANERGVEPVHVREMSREISTSDVGSLIKLFRRMLVERPDIIHTHTAKAGTLGRIAGFMYRWLTWKTLIGRPRKVKVLHTFHGHVFHSYYSPAKTRIFLFIERLLSRLATNRILVLSSQQLEEINSRFHVGRADQFSVLPLGIDLTSFEPSGSARERVRYEIGAADADIIVGYVGRLTEIKNIPMLLECAALERHEPIKFVIVGDGHLRTRLVEQANSLGLNGRVLFLGNRTDIAEIYNGIDIVALTSLNEGTPLSLIEAMAADKPVISTGVGGVRDLLGDPIEQRDGFSVCERGIRVDSFEPKDLSNGIEYLIHDNFCRDATVTRAHEFVKSRYSKERLITDIKSLYRELFCE
jgi:glycosyltransferase involved in cell wall biosynthesis